jgi:type VI secretion system protein ImpH
MKERIADPMQRLAEHPQQFDLFQALRHIEAAHPELPRLGEALRPLDEPVRFASEPALDFAIAAVTRLQAPTSTGPNAPKLVQRVMSFFGPNGALPIHLTEYARERTLHHGDRTFAAFADLLLHRFGLLFYRAWARSRVVVGLDRGPKAPVVRHVGSLIGIGAASQRERDALGDYPKLFFAGRLARSARDADGLQAWVQLHFGVQARVQQFCGHWMPLQVEERSRLQGRHSANQLGRGATLGAKVWDVQHKFRLVMGPLDWTDFVAFQPRGKQLPALKAMVREYLGFEFAWELERRLRDEQVPPWPLGRAAATGIGQLGRSAWLKGQRKPPGLLNVESISS